MSCCSYCTCALSCNSDFMVKCCYYALEFRLCSWTLYHIKLLVPSSAKMVICKFDVNANFKSLKSKTDEYGSKKREHLTYKIVWNFHDRKKSWDIIFVVTSNVILTFHLEPPTASTTLQSLSITCYTNKVYLKT